MRQGQAEYIFFRDYYYNHIVNGKQIDKYMNYYNKLLGLGFTKPVQYKRHYERYKDEAEEIEKKNLLYVDIMNKLNELEKNNFNNYVNRIKK